ncbi:tuberin [Kwoniella heveanensis BCC8398]|uniref:Tuberin n=1 Tax=Kwoniella heveanensis BCC8398 TaxID=1296120 RepID=A0A1B9GPH3_9TREE|nr:tuberin [Kwoniella heveanensis BCC8398]
MAEGESSSSKKGRTGPPSSSATANGSNNAGGQPITPASSSSATGGAAGGAARFLSRRVWGRASATTKTSTGNEELPETSGSASSPGSAIVSGTATHRKDSADEIVKSQTSIPAPPTPTFHLDEAIGLMDPDSSTWTSISGPELVEHVKATSVYLASISEPEEGKSDIFSAHQAQQLEKENKSTQVSSNDIRTLYVRAIAFADRQTDISLRIAGLRLLTSLIKTCRPPRYLHDTVPTGVPEKVTVRSLYALIIGSSQVTGEKKVDLVGAQVAALRVLTKDGTEVEGLGGVVGWLMRMLDEMSGDWAKWCEIKIPGNSDLPQRPAKLKPFEPIAPHNPLETAASIISLIHSITYTFIDLFDPKIDIPRLLPPIFAFVCKGIVASLPSAEISGLNISQAGHVPPPNPLRRDSVPSLLNSPLPPPGNQPILEPTLRRSISINRRSKDSPAVVVSSAFNTPSSSRIARHSTLTSPQSLTSAHQSPSSLVPTIPMPRWLYILPSTCAFLEILIDNTLLSQEQFIDIMRFACICVACDDESGLPTDAGQIPVHKLLAIMFRSNSGRRGEQALRVIMEQEASRTFRKTYEGLANADCKVIQGAVYIARALLLHLDDPTPGPGALPSIGLSSLSPSLIAALSTSRFKRPEDRLERIRWEPVDYAVLTLLQDNLHHYELVSNKDSIKSDIWSEGQSACDILKALLPVALPANLSLTFAEEPTNFSAVYDAVVHQLPTAIEKLHPMASSVSPFYHPKYIELLFRFGDHLTEEDAAVILDYYQREGLCLPMTAGWIENIWKLIDFFHQTSFSLPGARKKLAIMLFKEIYASTEEMVAPRSEFVGQVLVPYLDKVLLKQTDDWFRQEALRVMIRAAVAETMERDEDRRRARAMKPDAEVEEEDASVIPSQEVKEAAAGGSFHAIRNLIIALASTAWCKEDETYQPAERRRPAHLINRDSTASTSSNNPSALKGLMNVLSPPSRTKDLPSVAPSIASTDDSLPQVRPAPIATHSDCQSLHAVSALITIFNNLTFSPPHSFSSTAKAARTPASARCIAIYRDLLGLLYPFTDHTGTDTPTSRVAAVPARCPRARVAILQWLLRLRADPRHRIYLRTELDVVAKPYAETLFRTTEAVEAQRSKLMADAEEARAKAKLRQHQQQQLTAPNVRESVRDRTSTSTRSRSRSRPAPDTPSDAFNPLWFVPETLAFDMPADSLPSEGLLTYDPNHPSLRNRDAPPVEGVWLPVSEYVRALNGILRHERNWELVSYVLCFLPIQLSNKLFFRGGRATREVKFLLKALIDIIPQDDRIERRCNFHSYIKRPNVNAAVYQSLSILISYRDVLDPPECDALIAAFEMCLESNTVVAKPCIQALTLSIFELEQHLGKRLLSIIGKLRDINFTSGIAVHLIEFLIALGDNGNLFRNFTDAHYKDVFTLVIDYIAEHNARSDTAPDLEAPSARENYTLSQHVIGLAYHAIYVWFMALKLSVRPDLVKHIIAKLLQSRSKRVAVDEMAEVCLDWLARYTYGNADPKPASSFLADMVMADPREDAKPKTQSWMLGGTIITITTNARSGWSTITSTRPTGATEVIAKLENVPLLGLGEANADLTSLPAVLMANRNAIMGGTDAKEVEEVVKQKSTVSAQEEIEQSSQRGAIWSGATPSQRRKDVSIDPAYIAIELLSSYPNASLDIPRGRLIPNEEKCLRTLRTIESTPVIDASKLAVLYVARGQTNETEILGNMDGSSLYLDFLAGLGRLIRLKGQVDVHVGGLNREDDSDGEYAYAWWDDLQQTIFHTATMMPNAPNDPAFSRKKRLIGNDYVKIVYNDSGRDFAFDTIKTQFNFINIVISPHTTPESHGPRPAVQVLPTDPWAVWGRDDYFKVIVQRAPGIPDFSPVGEHKIVSRDTLPVFVRHVAHLANDMAARYTHIRDARSPEEAEYITSWRSRLRAMNRLRAM